jgi:hypothetical protein
MQIRCPTGLAAELLRPADWEAQTTTWAGGSEANNGILERVTTEVKNFL